MCVGAAYTPLAGSIRIEPAARFFRIPFLKSLLCAAAKLKPANRGLTNSIYNSASNI